MFLIMSAAYITLELESEFGTIPPSFLPLGNRRLFQYQVKLAPEGSQIYLSIPEHYQVSEYDANWLKSNNVNLLRIPEGLSLGASLMSALALSDLVSTTPLHILFGDTLLTQLPEGNDLVTISQVENSYDWAMVSQDSSHWLNTVEDRKLLTSTNVVCGYFKFNQPRYLVKALTMAHWDFIQSLNYYHEKHYLNSVETQDWLDFGHLNTYYSSKAKFTTQRAFNQLKITDKWIQKSSIKNNKIAAEANWFATVPAPLRVYLPQYLGSSEENNTLSYRLEYLYNTALNELYVFSALPELVWQRILTSCLEFIDECKTHQAADDGHANQLQDLFGNKTQQRLNEYCQSIQVQLNTPWIYNGHLSASFSDLLAKSERYLPTENQIGSVMHGDFCFSNILYDFRSNKIKTIDPRGIDLQGNLTIFGDTRYDLAKLSHSILGLYDWIIAGYYQVDVDYINHSIQFDIQPSDDIAAIQTLFIEMIAERYQLSANALYAMQIQLFLSMLPLHADDPKRQKALMANAFRLYLLIKDSTS
ncbi:capsular biosynthesis protein [Photobacterium damselae]|uniref:capsular biosynthesis protein n=1 Tax=Photobacterium damselae TaxID=38293 RepID=UPI00083BA1C8|nr:capsular biosynthesis protein [Photobacterium damselae]ODA20933.1 capsular biosynthesis protein [Photobacterium damselae subsp. damselae]TLS65837.1 capsular biosynthesis protein [Photobacterium damselae subsp. damselae]